MAFFSRVKAKTLWWAAHFTTRPSLVRRLNQSICQKLKQYIFSANICDCPLASTPTWLVRGHLTGGGHFWPHCNPMYYMCLIQFCRTSFFVYTGPQLAAINNFCNACKPCHLLVDTKIVESIQQAHQAGTRQAILSGASSRRLSLYNL